MFYEMDKLRSVPVPEPELADAQKLPERSFSMGLATQDGLLSQFSPCAERMPDDYSNLSPESSRPHAARPARDGAQISDSANMQIVVVATARKSNRKPPSSANLKSTTRRGSVWSECAFCY